MNVWLAVALVAGWLVVAAAVGVVIGAVVRHRDKQKPQNPPLSRVPRGNVDVTTAVPAVRRNQLDR